MKKISDIFGDTKKIGEIIYTDHKFDTYELRGANILGTCKPRTNERVISDRSALVEVLAVCDTLAESGLLFEAVNDVFHHHDREICLSKFFAAIEGWIKERGLPFLETKPLEPKGSRYVCDIRQIILSLFNIHFSFYTWVRIQFGEETSWYKGKDIPPFSCYFAGSVGFSLKHSTGGPVFKLVTDNLLTALEFQLALLASRTDIDGKSIKRCKKCGSWFEAARSNLIYCGQRRGCNAKSAAQHKWRNNKTVTKQ